MLLILITFALISTASGFLITGGIGVGLSIGAYLSKQLYCKFYECCTERWVPPNVLGLEKTMSLHVFGQPHVADIGRLIVSHATSQNPRKPLVLSFHGPSGTGKNHVGRLVTEALFKAGLTTNYANMVIGTHGFFNTSNFGQLKADFLADVEETVVRCHLRSLIIIDEADKLPLGLLDSLRPMMDYHNNVDDVDYRHTIFILISNSGQERIAELALDYAQRGKGKRDISVRETEQLLRSFLFNNNDEKNSGFYHSTLIGSSQIDHYFAFFPMEKADVKQCIIAEAKANNVTDISSCIDIVLERLLFVPSNSMHFSASGCKKIHSSVSAFCS